MKKDNIFLPVQKHTDTVLIVESNLDNAIADAVITEKQGILIGVQVADCVPVLLFDRGKNIIGAIHAGWRGTSVQIAKKTIQAMIEHFHSLPQDILVAIGPSIRWSCYDVGLDVKDAVFRATGDGSYYFEEKDGKCFLDLSSANIQQIKSMGVPEQNIWISIDCTYCNPDKYYSFRYSRANGGSQGGFIGIF